MSVIIECQAGDFIRCLQSFFASPIGLPFCGSVNENREFSIGERVTYIGYREDSEAYLFDDDYLFQPGLGWLVLFRANDGVEYESTQTYFVSEITWRQLHACNCATYYP